MQYDHETGAVSELAPLPNISIESVDDTDHLKELAIQASQGDPDALGALYERHVDAVYRYIHMRLRNHQDAENLTQETWLRVARTIRTYEPRAPFGAWVLRIAKNLLTDHFRSHARRPVVLTPEMLALDAPEHAPTPEDHAEQRDLARAVTALLAKLHPAQRECVTLRFYVGLSVAETAEAMGKNPQAVKSLQHRALARLGALVGKRTASTRNQPPPGDVKPSADVSAEVGGDV